LAASQPAGTIRRTGRPGQPVALESLRNEMQKPRVAFAD
jgi:hypothetical protein